MCQRSSPEVPLQMIVNSMCELISHVKDKADQCITFLPESDTELNKAFLDAVQTAAQLQRQLEQITRDLNRINERLQPRHTMITFFD